MYSPEEASFITAYMFLIGKLVIKKTLILFIESLIQIDPLLNILSILRKLSFWLIGHPQRIGKIHYYELKRQDY